MHTHGPEHRVNKQGSVFNHSYSVYLAAGRFFTHKPPTLRCKISPFRENIQTVLIPVAGKRGGLFPEQSITSEYKNKYEERVRSKPQSEEGKNLLGRLTAVYVFPLFHQCLGQHFSLRSHPHSPCCCLLPAPSLLLSISFFIRPPLSLSAGRPLCQLTHHKP